MKECRKAREWMSLMVDGELPEPQKTELDAHLAACADCRRALDALRAISFSLEAEPAPAGLASGVMDAVRAGRAPALPPPRGARRQGRALVRLGAAAACLALVLWAGAGLSPRGGDAPEPAEGEPAVFGMTGGLQAAPSGTDNADNADAAEDELFYDHEVKTGALPPGTVAATSRAGAVEEVRIVSAADGTETRVCGQALPALLDLLAYVRDAELPAGEGLCRLSFLPEGAAPALTVWLVDGQLVCRREDTGACFLAAGPAESFLAYLG